VDGAVLGKAPLFGFGPDGRGGCASQAAIDRAADKYAALRAAKKAFATGRRASRTISSAYAYLCLTSQFAGTPECVQNTIFLGKGIGCGGKPGGTFRGLCQGSCTPAGNCLKVPCPQGELPAEPKADDLKKPKKRSEAKSRKKKMTAASGPETKATEEEGEFANPHDNDPDDDEVDPSFEDLPPHLRAGTPGGGGLQVAGTPYDNYPGDGYGAAPLRGDYGSGPHGMPGDDFNDEVARSSPESLQLQEQLGGRSQVPPLSQESLMRQEQLRRSQVAGRQGAAGTSYDNYPGDGYGAAPPHGDYGSGPHGMPGDDFNDEVGNVPPARVPQHRGMYH
jgi:hypothetical protein